MKIFIYSLCLLLSTLAAAWDGYDSDTVEAVEIGSGNLVRASETVEIYDYDDGTYKDVNVESVTRYD